LRARRQSAVSRLSPSRSKAQAFGQNDDITVLGVAFTGASQEALA
jgi:hypothetical protein